MTRTAIAHLVEQPAADTEQELARAARAAGVRTPNELAHYALTVEETLLAVYATPEGPDADARYSDRARDLLDTVEAWQDDPSGAWADLATLTG